MNPEIDLKHFSDSASASTHGASSAGALVSPPRRIVTRYILPLVLLSGFIAVGYLAFRESLQRAVPVNVVLPIAVAATSPEPSDTSAAASAAGRSQILFQAPGWIEPEPYATIISSLRMGTVKSVDVLEGQAVSSGTVIARLVADDADLAVASAESALALKRAKYQAAVQKWNNPTDLVESVESARATSDRLQAEARRLEEMLELAKVEAEVGSALSRGGYEATLETLRKKTELSASRNQLAETHAQIKLNSATLSAASERLSLRIEDREAVDSARAEVAAAETALQEAQLQLNRSVIKAPTSGTIMRLYASPGSMLSTEMERGMAVASLYQPDHLQVRVDVPLAEAAKVKPGLDAEIRVEALPDRKFKGELINIVPEFDIQKNTLPVKVRINDPDDALRPEMIARVEFVERQVAKAGKPADSSTTAPLGGIGMDYLIPAEAVQTAGDSHEVFVVSPEGTAVRRKVQITESTREGYVVVTDGLRLTDKVIQPGSEISDNIPVKIAGTSK